MVRKSVERMEELTEIVFSSVEGVTPDLGKHQGTDFHFEQFENMHHNQDYKKALKDFEDLGNPHSPD